MTKEQFVSILDRRLQVIDENERKDIIDEYVNHIDMRISEGKSEEEAIADFGDIDELIDEILAAYKIDYKKVNNGYDRKLNNFLDDAFNGFQKFISSFTSLDGDSVVRLMFEFFVVLLLLLFVRVAFWFVADLGDSLFRSLLGYGIGHLLGGLWNLIIHIAYIVVFFVVLINVIAKRVRHYRDLKAGYEGNETIIDDFKDSFRFDQVKESVNSFNNRKKANEFDTAPNHPSSHHPYREEADVSQVQNDRRDAGSDIVHSASTVAFTFVKIFVVMLILPFAFMQIGLFCVLAFMIVLSVKGFTLIGAYFIIIGLIIGIGAFIDVIYRFAFKGGASK